MAEEIGNLSVKIGGDIADFSAAIKKATSAVSAFANDVNSSLSAGYAKFDATLKKYEQGIGRLGESISSIGKGLSIAVTLPIIGVGGAALSMAADMEKAEVAFTTMLGSAEKAKTTLKDLADFAAETPFEFPEIQAAGRSLLAFGVPAEELKNTLRGIGDIAAGVNAPIGELAELFGKAKVQGRLFAEDINQLTGRGIPVIQELAKQFGVAETEVKKLVESGQVNFANLQEAFRSLTSEGGKFSGLMAAQSQTVSGLFSTLKDNVGRALADLGKEIIEAFNLKEVIKQVGEFVGNLGAAFANLSPEVKRVIVIVAAVVAAIGPLLLALGSIVAIVPTITAGLGVLTAAFAAITGPIALIVAAIAGAAILIITNWDKIVAYFSSGAGAGIWETLKEIVSTAIDTVVAIIKGAVGTIIAVWRAIEPIISGVFETAFQILGPLLKNALGIILDIFKVFKAIFTGDWAGLWSSLINIFKRIWNQVVDVLVGAVSGLSKLLQNVLENLGIDNAFTKGLSKLNGAFDDFADKLKFSVEEPKLAVVSFSEEVKNIGTSAASTVPAVAASFKKMGDAAAAELARLKKLTAGIQKLNQDQYGNQTVRGFDKLDTGLTTPTINTDAAVASMQSLQEKLKPIIAAMRENWAMEWAAMGKVSVDTANLVSGALNEFANLAGETLGALFTGEFNADAFFSGLMDIVLNFLSSFGKALVSAGIAALAFQSLLANPVAAVAAGTALIATAAIIKNLLKKGPGGGVPALATGTNFVPNDMLALIHKGEAVVPKKYNPDALGVGSNGVEVSGEFRVKGSDLVMVLEKESYRQGRRG